MEFRKLKKKMIKNKQQKHIRQFLSEQFYATPAAQLYPGWKSEWNPTRFENWYQFDAFKDTQIEAKKEASRFWEYEFSVFYEIGA